MTIVILAAGFVSAVALIVGVVRLSIRTILSLAAESLGGLPSTGLPSRLVGDRICSQEDFALVTAEVPAFQKEFRRDRKILMLLWLRCVRAEVIEEVRRYRAFVRVQTSASPLIEFRLAVDYFAVLLLCEIAACLILVVSPVKLRATMSQISTAASEISFATRQLHPEGLR